MEEYGADPDHAEDDVAEAVAEVLVASALARRAQECLTQRVELAGGAGAGWRTVGKALGVSPWRAWRGKWQTGRSTPRSGAPTATR
jgi:hypothetical protein